MELELCRTYYPEGTTGQIFHQGSLLTHSIELPWKDNHTRVSCIPEGKIPGHHPIQRAFQSAF